MRKASPSIVPGSDHDIYLVLNDYGRPGIAWAEIDIEDTRYETVLEDLLDGQYSGPLRVIGFNTVEGWSRDVSEDVARDLVQMCTDQDRDLPGSLEEFVERWAEPKKARQRD